jgi:hypothetical protein
MEIYVELFKLRMLFGGLFNNIVIKFAAIIYFPASFQLGNCFAYFVCYTISLLLLVIIHNRHMLGHTRCLLARPQYVIIARVIASC